MSGYMFCSSNYRKFFVVFSVLALSACGTMFGDHGVFRGKTKDYLRTDALAPMDVPPEFNSRSLQPLYAIPQVRPRDEFGDYLSLGDFEVPRPAAINTEKSKASVKLQKLGDKKWIFLNASTSQVWPRTQNFLSEYGIRVVSSSPANGVIETADVVFKDALETKSRFRIRIEKGVHPETTEVHILQTEFAKDEVVPAAIDWPQVSKNIERERLLLDELANVLAKNVNNNAASLLGQNVGGGLKVEFLQNNSEPTMHLRLIAERARATIVHALERDGFLLWEELSDEGLYYVGFNSNFGGGNGMFRRLFGNSLPETAPYPIAELLKHLAPQSEVKEKFDRIEGVQYGEALPDTTGFLVVLDRVDNGVDVVVRDVRGLRLPRDEAKELLRTIRKNLI